LNRYAIPQGDENHTKADLFDYIEMLYNPKRRHSHLGSVSPEAFERASNDGP